METKIISGFPGVGKTTAVHNFHDPYNGCFVLDSDSSKFNKEMFPQNYLEHIYYTVNISKPTVLLVSSHDLVRDGLVQLGLTFDLVYPEKVLMGEYIQRFIDRGNNSGFIDAVYSNWDAWIDSCENQKGCQRVKLLKGQFLSNYLTKILNEPNNHANLAKDTGK